MSLPRSQKSKTKAWVAFTLIYLILLGGIGYIAFSKQYFNDVDVMAGQFYALKEKYTLSPEEISNLDQMMVSAANSSNDLQALASQSFNIICMLEWI